MPAVGQRGGRGKCTKSVSVASKPPRVTTRPRRQIEASFLGVSLSLITSIRLDPFQVEAIGALDAGDSILVSAPTGSGKTLIALHAIGQALARGSRAIYTTPIKALSNQKHREMGARFGPESVGLLTGDRSLNPHAPVVVMTTEILRALLLDPGAALLRGVDLAVLDEFHFIQDPDRGAVWEEIVMAAPVAMTLAGLSATLPDVDRVHAWMNELHPPVALIVETARPVELEHLYAIGNLRGAPPMVLPTFVDDRPNEIALLNDGTRRAQAGLLRVRDTNRPVTPPRAHVIAQLREFGMLPAIWFVLSRSGCDRAAAELAAEGVTLNNHAEAVSAAHIAERALGALRAEDARAIDASAWRHAFEIGVVAHHGGLLPVQREAVELAFADGLIKVVFATETLAVGVNLPARTVVIDRVTRPDGQGRSTMSAAEFTQLAGRAGRRGLDVAGHVVVPWQADVSFPEVAGLAGGRPRRIASMLRCSPTLVAGLAARSASEDALVHLDRSLFAWLDRRETTTVRDELQRRRAELAEFEFEMVDAPAPPPHGPSVDEMLVACRALTPGHVVVDPGRWRSGPMLVLGVRRNGGEPTAVEVLGIDGRRLTRRIAEFRHPPVVVQTWDVEWQERQRGQARELTRRLASVEVSPFLFERAAPRDRDDGGRREAERLRASCAALVGRLQLLEHRLTDEFAAMVTLLQQRGHLDGFTLTDTGVFLGRLYHPQALLIGETLAAGLFDGLDAASLAALCGAFRSGSSRIATTAASMPAVVRERIRVIAAMSVELNRAEGDLDLPETPSPDITFVGAIHRWACGESLAEVLDGGSLLPGDFVREIRQTLELLDQMAAVSVGLPCAQAVALIDRAAAAATLHDPFDR